jgi:PKD repeat protein
MQRILLLTLISVIVGNASFSQSGCPGCVINNNCSKPQDVTICPPSLPDACFNSPYDENITFYIPKNLIYQGNQVTLASIQVVSITNVPTGLNWELDKPSGFYQVPTPETRGCIRICGTPTVFGTFFITVTVNANVTSPINTTQTQSFTLPLVVKNCGGGNPFFTYNANIGCDTLGVQFEGTYIASPPKQTEFEWDFGDGTTATGKKPARKFYSQPGTYLVTLNTKFFNLTLDSVTATVTGDWFCGDIEEPNLPLVGCTAQPDPQFFFTSGNATIKGNYKSDTRNAKWNRNELLQSGNPFILKSTSNVIRFEDYDPTSANDDGGTATLTITQPGVYPYTTIAPSGGGVSGNIYIGKILDTVYTYTDTVIVHPLPPATSISFVPDTVVCGNFDVVLSVYDGPYRYVWIKNDTSVIPLEVSSSYTILGDPYLVLDTISVIRVEISDTITGCIRKTDNIYVRQKPPIPGFIEFSGIYQSGPNTLYAEPGYTYQWLLDGFPIAGATSQTFNPPINGNYSCIFTNSSGCVDTSNVIAFVISGVNAADNFASRVSIVPNPSDGLITLLVSSLEAETLEVSIYNNIGQLLLKDMVLRHGNSFKKQFNLQGFATGNYVLHLNMNGQSAIKRFTISH